MPRRPSGDREPWILKGGEAGWILETNEAMNRGLEAMSAEIVKKYRLYERSLGD